MSSKKQASSTANVSKQQIPATGVTTELSCPSTNTTNGTASKQQIPAAKTTDLSRPPTNTTTASKSIHSVASDILGKTSILKLLKL